MEHRNEISDTDQLKRVLLYCWTLLSPDTLNQAISQLPKIDDSYQGEGCPC